MTITRRAFAAALPAFAAAPLRAQVAWPERTITWVHGFAPGGSSDTMARILTESLARRLGQQIVVDARPGAGGRVATAQVARAAPDGYTLMGIASAHAVAPALYKTLAYRTIEDFSMIGMLTEYPFVAVVNAEYPVHSFAELIGLGRTRGTPLLFGSAGNGSLQHLAGEYLGKTAGIKVQHVPYRGSVPALTDLLAKRLDFIVDSPAAELEFIRAGKVRALAVTGATRFFSLPEIPTTAEVGLPEFTFTSWQGLLGPAGLPPSVVARLNAEVAQVLLEPSVIERLRTHGNMPSPSTPDALKARIAADADKWIKVVEAANIERI